LSYYGGLACGCPDPVAKAVAGRIVADERAHVRFQAAALATRFVVAIDHHGVLRAIGDRPRRFAFDVFADFKMVAGDVLS
jgi:hypothetical protein